MTPYYENDLVTLYQGDCIEVLSYLKETSSVKYDSCITDPPYGSLSCKWDSVIPFADMWQNLLPLMKPESAICLFGSEPFSSFLRCSNMDMFKYDWIWDKKKGLGFLDAKYRPLKSHEIVSVFSQGGCSNGSKIKMNYFPQGLIPTTKQNKRSPSTILNSEPKQNHGHTTHTNYPKSIVQYVTETGLHPTQKPVELLKYLVKTYTPENGFVLDFTAGSGTTGVACMKTGRQCTLIEKDKNYCDVIVKRLEEME